MLIRWGAGRTPQSACKELQEVIYYEELKELFSSRKQKTNEVSWSQSRMTGFVLPKFLHADDKSRV